MAEIELVEDVDLGGGWEGEIKRATYRSGNETYLVILFAGYGGTAPSNDPNAPAERGYRVLEGEYFTMREARDALTSMLSTRTCVRTLPPAFSIRSTAPGTTKSPSAMPGSPIT